MCCIGCAWAGPTLLAFICSCAPCSMMLPELGSMAMCPCPCSVHHVGFVHHMNAKFLAHNSKLVQRYQSMFCMQGLGSGTTYGELVRAENTCAQDPHGAPTQSVEEVPRIVPRCSQPRASARLTCQLPPVAKVASCQTNKPWRRLALPLVVTNRTMLWQLPPH